MWHVLLMQDPLAGQAFTCGGDLVDTYWYAQGAGAGKLAEQLRSYRLQYLAERVKDLAAYLPEHAAEAIQHSLDRWSIGETVKRMDEKARSACWYAWRRRSRCGAICCSGCVKPIAT